MMTLRLQCILVAVLLIALGIIINLVRLKKFELKYALTWIIADVAVLLIVLIPGLLDMIAKFLGIYSVMNMIFFFGFCFLLIIAFILTLSMSRNSNRIRVLTQKIALYENELAKKEEK